MTEQFSTCRICSDSNLKEHLPITDYFGEKEVFNTAICEQCTTVYTVPRPDEENIIKYYKSNSYKSHGDKKGGIIDKLYNIAQQRNFAYKYKLINKYSFGKKLLDYGCGAGAFLNHMQTKGYKVTGVEPDADARNHIPSNIPVASDISEHSKSKFDVITSYHVIEHVHQLIETMNNLSDKLDRNGVFHMALPNYKSWDAQHYAEHWAGYDVPRHLYHFSQKSVHTLAQKTGLNIVATHPLVFDSYYVSLLSEEYRTGSKNYIRAFKNGFVSNRKAKHTGEYSSLIYILTK
ncbi:class I SAM-dependent methyltransferase [Roseivirga pacifica]|uniref:class I SAM-dependent methyltransferase n=1 Tax=Roseivirga pacifica TaxID=1267423 RepID=UPI003BB0F237